MLNWVKLLLKPFLCFSIAAYACLPSYGEETRKIEEKYKDYKFKLPKIVDEKKLLEEIAKKHPQKSWKKSYYCNWNDEVIMEISTPSNFEWKYCEPKKSKSGEKCCTFHDDGGVDLSGLFKTKGIQREIKINFDVHDAQMMNWLNKRNNRQTFSKLAVENDFTQYIQNDSRTMAIVEVGIDSRKALKIRKQWNFNVVSIVAIDRLIFQLQGLRGTVTFSELEDGSFNNAYVPFEYRILDGMIDEIIKTIKIRANTEIPPEPFSSTVKK